MSTLTWIWIPITLLAAAAQTVRNAAQRSLTAKAGTLAATFVRFSWGLPFALLSLMVAAWFAPEALPEITPAFLLWVSVGGVIQLIATAFLLAAMEQRSFAVAMTFSKTELIQIALYSMVLLGEPVNSTGFAAILLSTIGVICLSLKPGITRNTSPSAWLSPSALLGLGAGAGFALSVVCFRGATLATGAESPWLAGTWSLVWAQMVQTMLLGAYLVRYDRVGLRYTFSEWRVSILAGMMGGMASVGWLTALAMRNAPDVRTLGMVDVLYGYLISRFYYKEPVSRRELIGMIMITTGIVLITVFG